MRPDELELALGQLVSSADYAVTLQAKLIRLEQLKVKASC
jgi:hypothetical protein